MAKVQPMRISDLIGGGYDDFWASKHEFRVVKGSKGSKKSKTAALNLIYRIMKYPGSNALVVRKVFGTLQQSCYTDLLWAINKLNVRQFWTYTKSPLQITYEPYPGAPKQVILFRGLDDPLKLASISVEQGNLCWVWIEEAYEITDYEAFVKLEMSIRGEFPEGSNLFKQFTLTFNPWSEHTWIKERFFDNPDEKTFVKTTTYKCNEWLSDEDRAAYERLYISNPRLARVVCDGHWGRAEGLIYENWREEDFNYRELLQNPNIKTSFGLDFGYATSYNAFVAVLVDIGLRRLWIYDEMYERGMTNLDIAKKLTHMGYSREQIWADCAEPKSIFELQSGFVEEKFNEDGEPFYEHWQLPAIRPALKGPDSVANGIQRLQSFEMIVHPRCRNMIMELQNYAWEVDKDGRTTGKPEKEWDHLCDALRYATDKFFVRGKGRVFEAHLDSGRATEHGKEMERREGRSRRVFAV